MLSEQALVYIHEARRNGSKWVDIAPQIGVSLEFLKRWRRETEFEDELVEATDEQIGEILIPYMEESVLRGEVYCKAKVLEMGYRVTREQLRRVIHAIDPDGVQIRTRNAIPRVICEFYRRDYMWAFDGVEKFVNMYGIYIFSIVDCHTGYIIASVAASNKDAATVMAAFRPAFEEFGVPEWMRSDNGSENVGICEFANYMRNRLSALKGVSVHNIRIERLNKEIGKFLHGMKNFYERELKPIGVDVKDLRTKFVVLSLFLPLFSQILRC